MSRTFLSIIYIIMCLPLAAQMVEVSGKVKDLTGRPVPDVIVKVVSGKSTLAFVTTNMQGTYTLSYDHAKAKDGAAMLSFSHIAYANDESPLPAPTKGESPVRVVHDAVLLPKAVALKEVKVKAEPLRLAGDTLSYNLQQFLGKGDVTLEDGLKRLPGITVAQDGAISYMGQGISRFYIEGLDMLGGRYNLATKNIPAEYATQVEVLQHHKARRVDSDEESNDVALNIRLARKAKFKPFGQEVVGAGTRPSDLLGLVGLTGMMFTDQFQLLGSAKFSNHGNFGSYDLIDHNGNGQVSALAASRLNRWGGGAPAIGEYLYATNGYGTLNGINKVDSTRQLRVNADYAFERNHNSYETTTWYYMPDGSAVAVDGLHEVISPLSRVHRPMLEVRFENNGANRYFAETLRLQAQFEDNECPVQTDDGTGPVLHSQQRKATVLSITNSIWSTVRMGRHKFSITSDVGFNRAPRVRLSFDSGLAQTAQSTTLSTNHRTSFNISLGSKWRIALPVRLAANYDMIETTTLMPPSASAGSSTLPVADGSGQRLSGWTITPSVTPGTEWRSANRKAYVSMGMGVQWTNLLYNSDVSNVDSRSFLQSGGDEHSVYSSVFLTPQTSFRYTFNGRAELALSSGISHSVGDILNLLTTPVLTTYRATSAASGIIGKSSQWSTSVDYKYQVPFSYLTVGTSASWSQGKRNVLSSRIVNGLSVENAGILRDSHVRSASAGVNISKNILPITTKLSFTLRGNWGSSESMTQNVIVTTYTSGYVTDLNAVVAPLSWMEVVVHGHYSRKATRYQGQHSHYDITRADASVAVYPMATLELQMDYNYVRTQIAAGDYKHANFLRASAQLKQKHTVWRLTLDNLLDMRQYTYTTFSLTDRYTFCSHLIGRTLIFSCKLNLAK